MRGQFNLDFDVIAASGVAKAETLQSPGVDTSKIRPSGALLVLSRIPNSAMASQNLCGRNRQGTVAEILETLVAVGQLRQTADGRFVP